MPHHLNGIVSLLNRTQENGDYSCSFGSYMYSGPFNAPCGTPLNTKGKDSTMQNFMSKFNFNSKPITMRKMNALNETYEWEM